MTKEEQILLSTLRGKFRQCENKEILTHSGFLSPADVNLVESFCIAQKARFLLDGGFEDAERRICVFLPDWMDTADYPGNADLLAVLRVDAPKPGRQLVHRDYMGSILGLGVERSVVGDIIVRDDGADIVILKDMAEFFLQEFSNVGRASVSVSLSSRDVLGSAEIKTEQFRDTVASLRLDSILAGVFKLARGKAQDAVRQGFASVNGRQILKPDFELSEGDRISLRGKGKAILSEVGGKTRKDRIAITIEKLK